MGILKRRQTSTDQKDCDETHVHGEPRHREGRGLFDGGKDEEQVAEELQAEDCKEADVQVGRLTLGIEP